MLVEGLFGRYAKNFTFYSGILTPPTSPSNHPTIKFDERFARQYRFEPPPEFPLASPYSTVVHHLSGPTDYALTQVLHQRIKIG